MPGFNQRMLPSLNTAYKVLIYSILIVSLILFSYLANYAMVFRITAAVVSYLAIAGVLCWNLYHLCGKKLQKSKPGLLFAILSLYSLHRWFIVSGIIISFLIDRRSGSVLPPANQTLQRARILLPEILISGPVLLGMDVAREYSVWHNWNFQLIPVLLCLLSLISGVWILFQTKQSAQ